MTLSREVMTASSVCPWTLKWASLATRMSRTADLVGSALTRSAYRITKKIPTPSPTTRMISRESRPSLMETPANPEAMPVAKGLIVEPRVPMPHPRRTMAAPVRAS